MVVHEYTAFSKRSAIKLHIVLGTKCNGGWIRNYYCESCEEFYLSAFYSQGINSLYILIPEYG